MDAGKPLELIDIDFKLLECLYNFNKFSFLVAILVLACTHKIT